jgi:hypothetical protein
MQTLSACLAKGQKQKFTCPAKRLPFECSLKHIKIDINY